MNCENPERLLSFKSPTEWEALKDVCRKPVFKLACPAIPKWLPCTAWFLVFRSVRCIGIRDVFEDGVEDLQQLYLEAGSPRAWC